MAWQFFYEWLHLWNVNRLQWQFFHQFLHAKCMRRDQRVTYRKYIFVQCVYRQLPFFFLYNYHNRFFSRQNKLESFRTMNVSNVATCFAIYYDHVMSNCIHIRMFDIFSHLVAFLSPDVGYRAAVSAAMENMCLQSIKCACFNW